MELKDDLTFGIDVRGDAALFIEAHHINGWEIDKLTKEMCKYEKYVFFRVLENGVQQHGHGWIEGGRITQWG